MVRGMFGNTPLMILCHIRSYRTSSRLVQNPKLSSAIKNGSVTGFAVFAKPAFAFAILSFSESARNPISFLSHSGPAGVAAISA